jgi:hypothetical protein
MNSFSKILIAGLLAGGLSVPAFAQASDTDAASSSVTIIQPISMTKIDDLVFGTVVRPTASQSTITIAAADGTFNYSGARINASAAPTRARFNVTGETGYTANFNADATVTLDDGGAGDAIVVTLTESATTATLTGGAATFYVGGSFTLPSGQLSGVYTGNFNATVSYN